MQPMTNEEVSLKFLTGGLADSERRSHPLERGGLTDLTGGLADSERRSHPLERGGLTDLRVGGLTDLSVEVFPTI
jgi:hypothetical protein